jgi:HD-like signal output (HDOD) protein
MMALNNPQDYGPARNGSPGSLAGRNYLGTTAVFSAGGTVQHSVDAASQPDQDNSQLLKRIAGLPPFPTIALRLLAISTESETAFSDYEDAYKADPASAMALLQAANSCEFGLRARVDSIRQALTLLGLDRVNALSVTIAMKYYMREAPRVKIIQPMWSHSIASAVIAETLGSFRGSSMSGLYTAGLVHDVGRLGLLMGTENRYAKLLAQPVSGVDEGVALERGQFGLTHPEAGTIMAKSWGFPALLCNAIRYHHEEEGQRADERLRLVQVACRCACALGYGEHGDSRQCATAGRFELPPDLRGRPTLDLDRLRQRIIKLLFTISAPS